MNHDSPAGICDLLRELGVTLKKRWGQNFLINRSARLRIVELVSPQPGELLWEVGAGLGSLTELLLPRVERLVGFEIDRGLARYLAGRFGGDPRFVLQAGDVMRVWNRALGMFGPPAAIVGNLPYATASALIAVLAEGRLPAGRMVFTVQRELAARMTARPGTKSYSSFSVLCQAAFRVRERMQLKPRSFYPAPHVVSTVLTLAPRLTAPGRRAERPPGGLFLRLVRAAFAARRKTLRNNLQAGFPPEWQPALMEALNAEGIDPGLRSETLPVERFLALADRLAGLADDLELPQS